MTNRNDDVDYGNYFRTLAMPHIVVRPDADLTIVAQNDAHERLSFKKRRQTIGKPLLVAFPDTSPQYQETGVSNLVESFKKVVRTKKPDVMPVMRYDLHDKNNQLVERWWRVKHYPLFNSVGDVSLVYQLTEDVTNEIKLQQQSDRIVSQLTSALEIGSVSTWNWDMKHDIVTGDKNLARNFGVSTKQAREGLPLQTFIDAIHPEDRQRVSDAISASVTNDTPYSNEYRTVTATGKVLWVKTRGRLQRDISGAPVYFLGVMIDITEQKEAQIRLAHREREYDALFNSTIVAIAKVDTLGNILEVNKTFLRMFGYTKKEFTAGITSAQISSSNSQSITQTIYRTLRENGEAEPVRKEYKRKDGTYFTGLVGAAMLPGSNDTFMSFIVDVTENEQLKELNRAKDDFVALASHQLRSPATIVKQYIGVMLNELAGPLNEDQVQYLNIANNANNRQLTIIDDLLKTAQIDTKGFSVTLQPKNIVKILNDVIVQYDSIFDSRNQTVVVSASDDVIIVRADEPELATCIANLLENASKYSANGKTIQVTVSKERRSAILTVTDQGVGIAKANFDKIFDKFTRVDNELSDTVSGSGLGLYWVKRIVEIHGGTVLLTSKLGKGTSITVRLPL